MSNKPKLRVAIIGCGMIYEEHMPAWRELSSKGEVVAAVDMRPGQLEAMRRDWGMRNDQLFADWKTMLAVVRPDAVDICLPNNEHMNAALDAFAEGDIINARRLASEAWLAAPGEYTYDAFCKIYANFPLPPEPGFYFKSR